MEANWPDFHQLRDISENQYFANELRCWDGTILMYITKIDVFMCGICACP